MEKSGRHLLVGTIQNQNLEKTIFQFQRMHNVYTVQMTVQLNAKLYI